MILSFTKELANIFNLDLKASKSEVFSVTPVLDDWIMSNLWDRDEHIGVALIHKHSLFSMIVVSEIKDLFYCLDLFYEQLLDLMTEFKMNEEKYFKFFDNLFQDINAIKNDDKTTGSQIKYIYDKLEQLEEDAKNNKTKLHSIDISRRINQTPRSKLNFATPNEIFINLLKVHYNDQTLKIDNEREAFHSTLH